MKRAAVALAALSLTAALVPVLAGPGDPAIADADDTDGLLDLARARARGTEELSVRLDTYASWRARDIWDDGFLLVLLDTFGDERADYYALVRSKGNGLAASLYRDRKRRRDLFVRGLAVWRPARTSAIVKIPLELLRFGNGRLSYGWYAQSLFTGPRCRRVCLDFVPDAGAVQRPVPGAPTPSPSLLPTLSARRAG